MDSQTSKTRINHLGPRHQRAIIFSAATVTRHLFLDVVFFWVSSRVRFRYTPASHSIGITINHPAIGVRASPFYCFYRRGTLFVSRRCSVQHTLPFSYVLATLLKPLGGKSSGLNLAFTGFGFGFPTTLFLWWMKEGAPTQASREASAVLPCIQGGGLMCAPSLFSLVVSTREVGRDKSASLGVQRASYFVYLFAEKRKGALKRGTAWLSNNRGLSAWSAFKTSGCPATLPIRAFCTFYFSGASPCVTRRP